ncbi:YopX family protein [Lysinibacillus sp. 1 U-2021]|uniref:YopX family protein n=1 Tax=Lysinibacillus sp. 1 U-2021 TaxID=3039426 RepID=UPI002480AE73|nr:YopX family protein [Lysinibacillus sp. 1 U-2021]WGT37933.1 YopX family protein [Lysinibacillus sp. 1 U-2021]
MIVKVKCWNNDLKMWDECAYPLFKGMNPCEIIGFQDNEGSDKLIEDGHSVLLYSGLKDSKAKELYEDDICKSSIYEDELFIVKYSETSGQWFLYLLQNGTVMNNVKSLNWESAGHIERIGSKNENPELIK